jgi:hypothetical protein
MSIITVSLTEYNVRDTVIIITEQQLYYMKTRTHKKAKQLQNETPIRSIDFESYSQMVVAKPKNPYIKSKKELKAPGVKYAYSNEY